MTANPTQYPVFYGRAARVEKACPHCGSTFIASASTQTYCNLACATQANANKRRAARTLAQTLHGVREVEPCGCSHGLGRHLPTTGRPCDVCDCTQFVMAKQPARVRMVKP